MRTSLLILLTYLLCGHLSAQQIYFSNSYQVFNTTNTNGSVVQKPDSGYIFVTTNSGAILGYSIINVDKHGDTLFSKNYIFPVTYCGAASCTHAVIATQDGNYAACGNSMDTSNNRNGYVIKFTPAGDTLWTRTLGDTAFDVFNTMYEDGNGIMWLCGSTVSTGNGQGDCWLVRMDSNGNVLSDSAYGTALNETATCAELTTDGGFIMSGYSGSCPYVIKLDAARAVEWQYQYCNYNGFCFVSQANDSEYVVACCDILSATETQARLFKLNAQGGEVWTRTFGFALNEEILFGKPIILPDGIVVSGVSTPPSNYPGAFLAKTDLNGYMIWQRRYTINPNTYHGIYDVKHTSDNGFILSGYCMMTSQDAWLLKLDSMGCNVAGCDGVGMNEPDIVSAVNVYPNPANDVVTFQFSGDQQPRTVVLYDAFGKEVWREETSEDFLNISVQEFAEGIYFYSVIDENGTSAKGKLLVQ